ncbi:Aminopeptidase 2 mitochondrial [Malassezia cuniculi]|uniref:Aminopeptidase 2 mitochondrial n=1 Tax=Malassezia cuniculi TaxID=948313 RepID=A0AAF0J5X2_9BASI|nr:Aminopeptidase 2 mitochondrial [Malassezia cuniculi]
MLEKSTDKPQLYLPSDVVPVHYALILQADLDVLEYRGVVDVTININQNTSRIVLHADQGLRIGAVRVDGRPATAQRDAGSMTLALQAVELSAGSQVHVEIAFSREIDASLMGFFHAAGGQYAFTQFSPIAARRAFPCWDEPALKATFSFKMVHAASIQAIGNMPGVSRRVSHADIDEIMRVHSLPAECPAFATTEWALSEYQETPRMPTYLVGWAIGTFTQHRGTFKSPLTGRRVPLAFNIPEGLSGDADAVLHMQERMLGLLESMFGLEYPLPKLDTLVVTDFGPSAMENWGLIIGRADAFLTGPGTGIGVYMGGVATMGHELAHMWFGNLVSIPFWDSVWLKEALATLVGEIIGLARLYPDWDCKTRCIGNHLNRALELDGRRASHAIEIPLRDASSESIGQVFDAISYSKGASVLRMLAALVGEETFIEGLRQYLSSHLYANASVHDLWSAIGAASGIDVPKIMDNWVLRPGFPVLTVRDLGDGRFNVSQSRFLITGDAAPSEDKTVWHVPLAMRTVTSEGTAVDDSILDSREKVIAPKGLWKLNADTVGVYRVAYPPEHLALLGGAHDALTDADRIGLLGDSVALAQAGYGSTASVLTLANLVKGTQNSSVAAALAAATESVASVWWEAPSNVRVALSRFRIDVFGPDAQRLTLEYPPKEPLDRRALRTAIIAAAAAAGDALTVHELRKRFATLVQGGSVHPDLLQPALSVGIRSGDQAAYDFVKSLYTSGKMRLAALRALCAARDRQLEQTAGLLIDGTIRATDYTTFFSTLADNPQGRRLGWQLLSTHYDLLIRRGASNFVLPRMVAAAVSQLTTRSDEESVRAFFAERDTAAFNASLAQGLEAIREKGADRDTPPQLPRYAVPEHYDITLLSDLEELTFRGVLVASVLVVEPTRVLQLNAASGLDTSAYLITHQGSTYAAPATFDAAHERVTLRLADEARVGDRLQVAVAFAREIDASLVGYYYSTWKHGNAGGNYAVTQFAPTYARRAFPCWDEPALKAELSFSMIHRVHTTALGNMPAEHTHRVSASDIARILRVDELALHGTLPSGSWAITRFERAPRMSSYLFAFANGEFKRLAGSYTSPISGRRVPLGMFTTPEFIDQAAFCLEAKSRVVPEYERVFGIEYPLPKLDTLAVADFGAGAMENWGLIMGRTTTFLYDERAGVAGQRTTATVESHECAHMWFGNITTFVWWDNVWLNEAFASFMGELLILKRVYPDWDNPGRFVVGHLQRALVADAQRATHPIEVPLVGDNVEAAINQVFDSISYSKGASVLRMLAEMITEETFVKGVSLYLRRHLYGNATTEDLWDALAKVSQRDISTIMDAWVKEPGYPVISVCEGADGRVYVRQNRFLATGDVTREEDSTIWHVPLALRSFTSAGQRVDKDIMLDAREHTISEQGLWKLNADAVGVYRVAYPPKQLAELGACAALSDADRVGLIADAFALAQAGNISTASALNLVKGVVGLDSVLVVDAVARGLANVASVWWEAPKDVLAALARLRASIFGARARQVGFEVSPSDSVDMRDTRIAIVGAAAAANDEWTVAHVRALMDKMCYTGSDDHIHADMLAVVLVHGVRLGGAREYETALRIYDEAPSATHRKAAMSALCATQHRELLDRTIELLLTRVKSQDYIHFFAALAENAASRRLLWHVWTANYDHMIGLSKSNFVLPVLALEASRALTSAEDEDDVRRFYEGRDTSDFSMSVTQTLESIRARRLWLARDGREVSDWLRFHS